GLKCETAIVVRFLVLCSARRLVPDLNSLQGLAIFVVDHLTTDEERRGQNDLHIFNLFATSQFKLLLLRFHAPYGVNFELALWQVLYGECTVIRRNHGFRYIARTLCPNAGSALRLTC